MNHNLSSILNDTDLESLIMLTISSLSVGDTIVSKFGTIKKIDETNLTIDIKHIEVKGVEMSNKDKLRGMLNGE